MTRNEKARIDREQQRKIASDRDLRYRIVEADYGRELPWEVIWSGVTVARLSNPVAKSDGWTSYEIVPVTSEADKVHALKSTGFWLHPDVEYRNIELNFIATHAIPAGEGPLNERIAMQRLDFIVELSITDHVRLWWRSIRPPARR